MGAHKLRPHPPARTMPLSPPEEDDSWYVEVNCPKYFDFSAALQAPCSLDRQYNPPLHDFVYQSDEESDNFFRNAAASPKSPGPKHAQRRMLSPRQFGKPTNRHRPKASFEDFLRQHEMRQRRKNRRSVHVMGSIPPASEVEQPRRRSASPAVSFDKRSRYKSLPARRNNGSAQLQTTQQDDENGEHTIDLKTPTLDSIVTPVTMRRTARQYTPSRVRNPSNIARSLFASPGTPLASPMRRMRLRHQGSRPGGTSSGEPLRSSPEEQAQVEPVLNLSRPLAAANRGRYTLRLPARRTPPLSGGTTSSGSNPASRGVNKSRPYIDRSSQPPGESRLGPPLRAPRPSGSVGSTSTVTPPLPQSHSDAGSGPTTDVSSMHERQGKVTNLHLEESGVRPMARSERTQTTRSLGDLSRVPVGRARIESDDLDEIDDPDLLHKLEEHNRRMEETGREPKVEFEVPSRGAGSRSQRLPQNMRLVQQSSDADSAGIESGSHTNLLHTNNDVESEERAEDQQSRSLNDLLNSENDRILQERKQRLPERRKALQVKKEKVLKCLEGQRQVSAGQRKRTSARVEFTSSMAGQKPKPRTHNAKQAQSSELIRFKSGKPRNPGIPPRVNPPPQKQLQGFKARTKSVGTAPPSGDQNRNPNVPLQGNKDTSRSVSTKTSRTDKIKASTKQKMEETRLENDLRSMLSQHNNRVNKSKRGRA